LELASETGTGHFPLGFSRSSKFGGSGLDKIPLRQDSRDDEKRRGGTEQ
jgi:hypothetical protein